jgi:hypothetical protein
MNVDRAVETFCKYSSQEKTEFLLLLAHALTVLARETYEAGGHGLTEPSRLRRINEVQHRVLGSLIALRRGGRKRYPDDVVVRLILEHPEDLELQRQLEATVDRLLGERSATA